MKKTDEASPEFADEKKSCSDRAHYHKIGAIALTAPARTADRLQALSAGFDSHVAKPFEVAEPITVIAGLVRRTITIR